MATQIVVKASNPGYPGRWRAGARFFQHGVDVAMTVVEDPKDGPPLKASDPIDPETEQPDMKRISRAGLAELKADSECFSVLEGDQAASAAALDSALAEAKAAAGRLIEVRSRLAAVEAEALDAMGENEKLKARVAELEEGNLSLKGTLSELAGENEKLKAAAAKKTGKASKDDKPSDGAPAEPDAPPAK